jgi:NADH dehydrogenase [ubiquinone] 1 alpha subcomplex assembly factor 6
MTLRQKELNVNQFETLDELEDFAEHTQSSMLYATLHTLKLTSTNEDDNMAHAASHVGVSTGIVTLLRSIAYHAAQVRC